MPPDDRAIAICATFTAEDIQPGLAFWMEELGLDYPIRFAAYNQVFQELLNPAGLFAANTGGINVVLVRPDDWPPGGIREFVDAVRASRAVAPLVVVECAGAGGLTAEAIGEMSALPQVHLIAADRIGALYPVAEVHDPHGNELGRVPYTPEYFMALATAVARRIHALRTPPFKAIALDCDDTLWAGICGEDGPQGVTLDPPRRALQEFMAERRRDGMLVALCSKNNEEDVAETFRAHPEMPLTLDDFAASRVSWENKGDSLISLAAELDLGLDSFIFIDDNPKEAIEAQASAPEVLALALPQRVEDIPVFLQHVWAFDRLRVTDEDRQRPALYAQRAERGRAEHSAASLEDFLASLQLDVQIAPVEASHVERVAQLTQRTNQMNATCLRHSAADIQRLSGECLTVHVTDRFGSYGLTGAMIFRAAGDALEVDTFLLSCRALGRGVEHRMVARLGEIAMERGLASVEIPFIARQRNRPAQLFLESLPAAVASTESHSVFRLSAAGAAAVKYTVEKAAAPTPPNGDGRQTSARAAPRRIDYARIATELRTPAGILEVLRAAGRRAAPERAMEAPRTTLERDLAQLWADLLNMAGIGIHENFFELGGHSLLAVQLLSRVRQIYGTDLSLEVVYAAEFTVAELAKAIELKELEQAGGGDYLALLQELEGLSDEEARALLAEERDAT